MNFELLAENVVFFRNITKPSKILRPQPGKQQVPPEVVGQVPIPWPLSKEIPPQEQNTRLCSFKSPEMPNMY